MSGVSSQCSKNPVVNKLKKWYFSTESDLNVGYSFSTSVKFPVLLLAIEWYSDRKLWLFRVFIVAGQGLEDGENGENSAKMGAL